MTRHQVFFAAVLGICDELPDVSPAEGAVF